MNVNFNVDIAPFFPLVTQLPQEAQLKLFAILCTHLKEVPEAAQIIKQYIDIELTPEELVQLLGQDPNYDWKRLKSAITKNSLNTNDTDIS